MSCYYFICANKSSVMIQRVALAFRVYRTSLLIVGVLLTSVFGYLVYQNAGAEKSDLHVFIIARTVVFLPVLYLFYEFRKNEFTYYRNLGLSKKRLLIYICLIDVLLSIILLSTIHVVFK